MLQYPNPTIPQVEQSLLRCQADEKLIDFCHTFIVMPEDVEIKDGKYRFSGSKRYWSLNDEGKWEHD